MSTVVANKFFAAVAHDYDNGNPYTCIATEVDLKTPYPQPYFRLAVLKQLLKDCDCQLLVDEQGQPFAYKQEDSDVFEVEEPQMLECMIWDGEKYYNLGDFCFSSIERS